MAAYVVDAYPQTYDAPQPQDPQVQNGDYDGPFADVSAMGQPFAFWLGFIAVLFLMRVASEGPAIPGVPANVRVNAYNIATVTFMAMVGMVFLKMILARYPVPGLSTFVAAA